MPRWLLLLAMACHPDPARFDQTCEVDEDCAVVEVAPSCLGCGEAAAIHVDEVARWNRAEALANPVCMQINFQACGAWFRVPACIDGTCAAVAMPAEPGPFAEDTAAGDPP